MSASRISTIYRWLQYTYLKMFKKCVLKTNLPKSSFYFCRHYLSRHARSSHCDIVPLNHFAGNKIGMKDSNRRLKTRTIITSYSKLCDLLWSLVRKHILISHMTEQEISEKVVKRVTEARDIIHKFSEKVFRHFQKSQFCCLKQFFPCWSQTISQKPRKPCLF